MRSPGPQRSFFALRWTSKQMNEGHHCAPRKYRAQKVCLKMHTDNSITVHLHVVLPTYFVESYLSLPVLFVISVQIHLLCFLETGYRFHSLCLPSTWLFSHLLLLSSPLFPIQICPSSSISVQRSPMREHSHCLFHLQACLSLLEITWMALKLLQNKGSYKSTDCSNINDSNRAHTSKAAREFILVMRWRDALHISQLGLWFMPLNEVML